eukprot:Skav218449  [mRNA]  locus=scaffold538:139381:143205:- [translate_table: standard]
MKFELDAHLAADKLYQKNMQRFLGELDKKQGSKAHYAYVKYPPKSALQELVRPVQLTADATWSDEGHQVSVQIQPDQLHWGVPVMVDEHQAWVVGTSDDCVRLQFPAPLAIDERSPQVNLQQRHVITNPADIADQLTNYWLPIWNSDIQPTPDQLQKFHDLVDALPFQLQEISLDFCTEKWTQAIRKLRGSTAKGFDAITGWELKLLPTQLVTSLASVMMNDHHFPAWLMRARTTPISKLDEEMPNSGQIRPITVLALVYRVYASVICTQILHAWSLHFPAGITGLLPSRGSHDAAFRASLQIEIARRSDLPLSGLTLDLRKCFNMIWHHVGPALLARLGVPDAEIQRWSRSIAHMTRYWCVHDCTFGPYPNTRGLPEGDSHSVLIMLSIALLWLGTLQLTGETCHPTAYADNWSWMTSTPVAHRAISMQTLLVTGVCGLEIDWAKTWVFATSTAIVDAALVSLGQTLASDDLQRLHHARDLGFELQYSGAHRLGHRKTRYEKAQNRLKRLQHLPTDSVEKEKLWLTSILTQGFYGSEIFPPSQDVLKHFRSKAADAIYGASTSMAPSLALLFGKSQILDPGYQLIWKALVTARRWLSTATHADRRVFYDLVASFQGTLNKVKGPASALAIYLQEIDWGLTRDGWLLCDPFVKLHLVDSSLPRLKAWLTLTWQRDVPIRFTERKHLYNLQAISRIDTIRILNRFAPEERGQLIREIASAFQTGRQKSEWLEDSTGTCPFCPSMDSRYHRVFECPCFAHERAPFQPTLDWLAENFPGVADLPVILEHHDSDAHRILQYQEPSAVVEPAFFAHARRCRDADTPLHLYTDGSCSFPVEPNTRLAGFAVVLDLCTTDDERRECAAAYLDHGLWPESLQAVSQSRVQGEQTIGRAEHAALEVATRFPGRVHIHSDCQHALDNISKLMQLTFDFVKGNHLDIMHVISTNLHAGHVFHKIRAHVTPTRGMDLLEVYHCLGNQYADTLAKQVCAMNHSDFAASLHGRHADLQLFRDHLEVYYQLLLVLQKARVRVEQARAMSGEEIQLHPSELGQTTLRLMSSYSLAAGNQIHITDAAACLYPTFPWGSTWFDFFRQWFEALIWPQERPGVTCLQGGTSWVELAVSFSLMTNKCLPVLRDGPDGVKLLVWTATQSHCIQFSVTLADFSHTMMMMWGHFVGMLPERERPNCGRGMTKSLLFLGFGQHTCGLLDRPVLPCQSETIAFLAGVLQDRSSCDFALEFPWILDEPDAAATAEWLPLRDESYRRRRRFWKEHSAAVCSD